MATKGESLSTHLRDVVDREKQKWVAELQLLRLRKTEHDEAGQQLDARIATLEEWIGLADGDVDLVVPSAVSLEAKRSLD